MNFRYWHKKLALVSSLAILLICLSGSILVYKHAIISSFILSQDNVQNELNITLIGTELDQLYQTIGANNIDYLKAPNKEEYYWSVWLENGERVLFHVNSLKKITNNSWIIKPFDWLVDFHAHFLLGSAGEAALLLISLLLIFLTLSGIYLWWPKKSNFRYSHIISSKGSSRNLASHHKNLGSFIAIGLLVIVITGSTMLVQKISRSLFTPTSSAPLINTNSNSTITPTNVLPPSQLLSAVTNLIPQSLPSYIWLPNNERVNAKFRLRLTDEWHLNGRTSVVVDPLSGEIITFDRSDMATNGQRLLNTMWPLHSGRGLPVLYSTFLLITGLGLLRLVYSGIKLWWSRKYRSRI